MDGACVNAQQSCIVGKKQCSGSKVQECKDNGGTPQWVDVETCSESCADGACKTTQAACEIGKKQCNGYKIQECTDNGGTAQWTDLETCPISCRDAACSDICPTSCTEGAYSCSGKTLRQCKQGDNGCYSWTTVKNCERYCYANTGKCAEDLPTCELSNNSTATVIVWVDGDTIWVKPESNGVCNDYEYDSADAKWKRVRFNIRIHGIDAPECTKALDETIHYQTCTQDTRYTNDNEKYGYESWVAANELVPVNTRVTLFCDEPDKDGICPVDATGHRDLAYVGYSKDSASYDFSTELARRGMAFANTAFDSSKLKDICAAQIEAQNAHVGIWSTGGLSQMGKSKRNQLKYMDEICEDLTH